MDGRKFKRKLSEVNTRAVSRGHNELIEEFKMMPGMVVIIGIKREFERFDVDCDRKS